MYNHEKGLHRLDHQVIRYQDGITEWWMHGELHREGGPAIEYPCGYKSWLTEGLLHRLDGPAVLRPCLECHLGSKCMHVCWSRKVPKEEWWVKGQELTEDEFYRFVDHLTGEILMPVGRKFTYVCGYTDYAQ
jgi:hypothetical protein